MKQQMSIIKFERVFAMANKNTFKIKPISKLLKEECYGKVLDPFPYPYNKDALITLKPEPDESADVVLFDPPYSQRQLKECYENQGLAYHEDMGNSGYWTKLSREISRIVKPGGKVIKFGWNTGRIFKGFEITRIMLVCHGHHHNDTIVTVQRKTSGGLYTTLDRNCSTVEKEGSLK